MSLLTAGSLSTVFQRPMRHHLCPIGHTLYSSDVIRECGAAALEAAGIGIDELRYVDLYSCFPSAVQIVAAELGLPLDRDLTVTGGLTFSGGPWNNYVTHSIARMVGLLRQDPEATACVRPMVAHSPNMPWASTAAARNRLSSRFLRQGCTAPDSGTDNHDTFRKLRSRFEGFTVRWDARVRNS